MRLDVLGTTTRALMAGCVVLALVAALQWLMPAAPAEPRTDGSAEEEAALPEFEKIVLRPPAIVDLADMLERPLFFDDRRMPEPEEAAPPPPPTPLRLKLIGVALSGGTRVALLRNLVNNNLLQLAEGESHDGWTLDSVGAKAASFSRGPQKTELPLDPEGADPKRR